MSLAALRCLAALQFCALVMQELGAGGGIAGGRGEGGALQQLK